MQPLRAHHEAHEAEEYPAMSQSTTEIRIVPLPTGQDALTDLLRDGARRMLAQAIEAEVAAYVDAHDHLRDDRGRRQVVRNGHLPERAIQTGLGDIEVKQPRVHDRRPPGEREKFTPVVLPPYLRRTRSLEELIPWLYLKGISTGDFSEALQAILGPGAPNLSATRSPGSRPPGKLITRRGAGGRWPASITSTSGPTGSTSTSAWRGAVSASWC